MCRSRAYAVIFAWMAGAILAFGGACSFGAESGSAATPKVDFSYAFATPHRITIGRPAASERTLLDLEPGSLRMSWTYDDLTMPNYPLLSFKTPTVGWKIDLRPEIDGKPPAKSRWTRLDKVLPGLDNIYGDPRGSVRLAALGGKTGAIVRIGVANGDAKPHQFALRCDAKDGENPAWVDPARLAGDNLVAGWDERADRVLILAVGADKYSLETDGRPPKSKSMVLVWNLKPGEKRTGWLVRPYRAYAADLPALRKHDWAEEMEQGKQEWRELMGRAAKIAIPDPGVSNAFLACLGDMFIMREPLVGGYVSGVPGTEMYRAGNSGESAFVSIAFDQLGYHREAIDGFRASLEFQEPDGNWDDQKGWGHLCWAGAGFKSQVVIEHYRLTGDKRFLAEVYPRMAASSRWQERQRARMRPAGSPRPLAYGLMPRGFGDCGLLDGDDMYGIFLPHNIWAVYADRTTVEAAEALGRTEDLPELKKIYETARGELLAALDRGAIREKGYRWIPGVAGKTTGSRWGAVNAAFPCGLLPPDHELITGTLRKIESNMSRGGIPIHTGWMVDGLWVAIALDNLAETHLARGEGDAAAPYLYATLNHGTPLYTWCEERGQEPGAKKCSGDRQHLWTPIAVVRAIRDMLVMEDVKDAGGLHLALGMAREWLASGKPVGMTGAATHFGPVSYEIRYDAAKMQVTGEVKFADDSTAAWAIQHIRLPGGLRVKSVDAQSKAAVLPDGSGIRWDAPRGTMRFQASVGK